MSAKTKPKYYRLELDDYSAASFTSFGKYYYGTMEDLRCFFGELSRDKDFKDRYKNLTSTFQAFEEGRQNLTHYVAYREVPFLVPVHLLHKKKSLWRIINGSIPTLGDGLTICAAKKSNLSISGLPAAENTAVQRKQYFRSCNTLELSISGQLLEPCLWAFHVSSQECPPDFGTDWQSQKSFSRPEQKRNRIGRCFRIAQTQTIQSFAMIFSEMDNQQGRR